MQKLVNEGVFYISGRDRYLRPIFVINVTKMLNMKPRPEEKDVVGLVVLMNQFSETFMNVPGHIENRIVVVDLKDMWVWNLPSTISLFKNIFKALNLEKPCTDRVTYILNAPYSFGAIWKVVKLVLHASSVDKVKIESGNTCADLTQMVAPEQLETRYGGKAPDRTSGYWPPSYSSPEFREYKEGEDITPSEDAPKEKVSTGSRWTRGLKLGWGSKKKIGK